MESGIFFREHIHLKYKWSNYLKNYTITFCYFYLNILVNVMCETIIGLNVMCETIIWLGVKEQEEKCHFSVWP